MPMFYGILNEHLHRNIMLELKPRERKDMPTQVYMSKTETALIERASRLRNCSRAALMRDSAIERAQTIIRESEAA